MSEQITLYEVQRPNAVGATGGQYLLSGLMLQLPPSKNRATRSMPMVKAGTRFPLLLTSFRHLTASIRAITYPTDDYKEYVKYIREIAIERKFMFRTQRDLSIQLVVCPRDRRAIDAHNYHMVLLDAFQECEVFIDDQQIKVLTISLGPIVSGGRVIVSMSEITHDPQKAFSEAMRR